MMYDTIVYCHDIIGDCYDIIGDLSVSQYIVGVCSRSGLHRENLQHEH